MKYRAAVFGCGRIGAGFNWPAAPYLYDHCSAYQALSERVTLEWVFDRDLERAWVAGQKFGVPSAGGAPWWHELDRMMAEHPVDVVSICTRPEDRAELVAFLKAHSCIRAAWIEKPLAIGWWPDWKVTVNYIRRFDPRHVALQGRVRELWVWAKKDEATVCHFTDLARFWGLPREEGLGYFALDGPNSYVAVLDSGAAEFFPLGGLQAGSPFMTNALGNLLDGLEGHAALVSPPESAVVSEAWAAEILADHAAS